MFLEFFTQVLDRSNDLTDFDVHSIRKVAAEISFKNLSFEYYQFPVAQVIPEKIYRDFQNQFSILASLNE